MKNVWESQRERKKARQHAKAETSEENLEKWKFKVLNHQHEGVPSLLCSSSEGVFSSALKSKKF